MKELEEKRADVPRTIPPQAAGLARHAAAVPGPDAEVHGGVVASPLAAHPANAAPLARVLTQLQASHGNAYVQRMVSTSSQPALALDPGIRSAAEAALGEDLGDVRLHTDEAAAQEAEALGARAFTRGSDVYFGPGEYRPEARSGQELLAHELAHVVQQRHGGPAAMAGRTTSSADALEAEADRAAPAVLAARHVHVARRAVGASVQRKEKEKKDEAPSILKHGQEIGPLPPSGAIDAGGRFTIAYFYNIVGGADSVPLTLAVPEGVAVSVVALNDAAGDVKVMDSGGSGARSATVVVSAHMAGVPKIQVTFTRGSFTYLVVFNFLPGAKKTASDEKGK